MLSGIKHIDWVLFFATLPILGAGLLTMDSFTGENYFFSRQLLWIGASLAVFFSLSMVEWRFLKRTDVLITLFGLAVGLLLALFVLGTVSKGAQSWFTLGGFSVQPADPIKLLVILILAKYFSRRHIEIAHFKHIIVSGLYAFIPFVLVLLQPDFGSAAVIFFIWLGMIIVSGVSNKHLLVVFGIGAVSFMLLWSFAFQDYQKERITSFLHPLSDVHGAGYNARQSMIAVGSGELLGRGVGYGTQSRLQFLPEYETDFIFAAFAEEWGFIGVILLFGLYGVVLWRILYAAMHGASNFEVLYGTGLALFFMTHIVIHVGMNVGLLPVTGLPMPLMSYGGSHLITEFAGLGILMGMRRYERTVHRDDTENEMIGM